MESNSKTARPYALAAFKQAKEEGDPARWSDMMALLQQVTGHPDVAALIVSPRLKSAQVADFIIDVCGDHLSDTGRNFVRVLAESRRLGLIRDIVAGFEAERAREERRSDVTVTSAFELSEAERNDINVAMTRRLGTKVDITVTVDPALIGGVIIRSGDMVIDASVRGRLNQMAQNVA
jgi:F-type H+-transporting ATPase subunit delta